jgi:uncharacterized protein YjdB
MNLVRQLALLAFAVCSGLVLAGCQSSTKTASAQPTLSSISVTPATASVTISGTQALTVTGTFSDSSTLDLTSASTFSSDNQAVATVSGAGVVKAVASLNATTAGVANITVVAGGATGTATITVPPPSLVSIAVAPKGVPLFVAGTQALSVRGTYNQGSSTALTSGVTFASDHTDIATVSGSGVVTAVAVGTATITATETASGKTDTAVVTVTVEPLATLIGISATPTSISLAPAGTQQLTVKGTYSNGANPLLAPANESFVSSNTSVATVSPAGVVTAVNNGSATITVTDNASGLVASPSPTVSVSTVATNGKVYSNGALDTGVGFVPFGGSDNTPLPAPDSATLFTDGTAALKVVVTAAGGAYSGGAWVASAPRDLHAFNALTFWAKGSQTQSTLKVQLGNDASAGNNLNYQVENIGLHLTTGWQQFVIPLPDPAKATAIDGLISFADGNNNYTFWLANVQYASVPANVLGSGFVAGDGFNGVPLAGNPPSLTVPVNGTYAINPGPNSLVWTLGPTLTLGGSPVVPLSNGGNLNNDAWRWFTLTSSDSTVATVSPDGVITGLKGGTTTITGSLAGVAITGNVPVTVTAPLATPSNYAATPGVSAANVIALFDSSMVYAPVAVDTWQTGWSTCCNTLVDPYAIAGGNGVKQYSLASFVGVEFGLNGVNSAVDAAGPGMTTFHVDVWSPNPAADLEIQLVNDAAGAAAVGHYHAGQVAANTWVSLEIPLSSFTGLSATNKINQLLFVAAGPQILYIDNVYFHK